MAGSEILGLAISYLYALGLLALAEVLHRGLDVSQADTRKFVHINAGLWVFGTLILFYRWEVGIIPFASFVVVNALLYRYRRTSAIDSPGDGPGTVYFALAITLLFALFWRPGGPIDRAHVATAGAMALTWGDALAALVGRRVGRHRYEVLGSVRSLEGSAVMFAASFVAILLTLLLLPGSPLAPLALPVAPGQALLAAALAATAATAAEAISPRGTDNLSVPLVAALVVWGVVG